MEMQRQVGAETAAAFLTLVGNGKRLAILGHLLDREMSVGAIAEKVGLSQSALSQHLAKLRGSGLVHTRRDRQMIYYSCDSEPVRKLIATLEEIYGPLSEAG
jgi:ArsR family transcriptional regulator, virulence genes transcriptional regulator